jgi:hypothetical protein
MSLKAKLQHQQSIDKLKGEIINYEQAAEKAGRFTSYHLAQIDKLRLKLANEIAVELLRRQDVNT